MNYVVDFALMGAQVREIHSLMFVSALEASKTSIINALKAG
jgi:hypothetical protein